jgi:mannose-6-phosphate isomerase
MTIVQTGPFAGHSLKEWIQSQGIDRLPILIKIIDAKKDLSVQVHPNDKMAVILNSEAKSESWYALDDGFVYVGFNQNVTLEQVKDAILANTLESLLQRIEIKKGEMSHIPGGTVHAIGSGSFILEIQQNSNTTYRLYDWGRVGADGKPRPLHVEEGLAALDWENLYVQKAESVLEEQTLQYRTEHLLETPYYIIRKITINGEYKPGISSNFLSYFCEEGKGVLYSDEGTISIQAGESFILPAESVGVHISGNLKVVEVRIPKG